MDKMTITALGNAGSYNYFIIKKEQKFWRCLGGWLYKSFPGKHFCDIDQYADSEDGYKQKKKKIENYEDTHEGYVNNDEMRIDAFFGKRRIFFVVITSLENRKRLMDNLDRYAVIMKPKKRHSFKSK